MDTALRPMSTSQVLDRTFSLYRNNFFLFAGIALIVPALRLIADLAQLAAFGPLVALEPGKLTPQIIQQFFMRSLVATVVGAIVYLVGTAFASSATIYAVSMVHLGKATTITESYAKIRPIFWRILGLIIRVFFLVVWPFFAGYLAIILAAVAFAGLARGGAATAAIMAIVVGVVAIGTVVVGVVWAIVGFCRYALAVPACTLERLPAKASVIRSKFLTRGRKGSIFLIYVLWLIMTMTLGYVLQLPELLANHVLWFSAHTHFSTAAFIWFNIAQFLAGAIAGPIVTIALVLVYYDQRVRKEAFDLQLMMEAVGMAQQPQVQAQAAGSGPTPNIG